MMETDKLSARLATLSPVKRALLELKLRQGRGRMTAKMTIPRRAHRASAPLSFAQQRLWFLNQLEPGSFAYNERSALRLDGPLDIGALRSALNTLVERHEVLRTTYSLTDGGEPVQQIGAAVDIDLPVVDIGEVAESQRDDTVQRIAAELRERSFDLRNDMPLRLALIRLGPNSHILVSVKHHIASDGWSSGIFSRELATLYSALSQGRPNPLSELPVQYADYSLWQREWLQGEVLETQLAYWKAQLKDIPVLELPMDRPPDASVNRAGAKQIVTLSELLTERLKTLSSQEGATLFMTLLTAFDVLLHRYTGQDDIAVGSPIAGRTRSETEALIGFFVNTLVLRTKLSGNPTFKELLAQVREGALHAYEHQDLPFEKLVEELKPERNQNKTPFFQVMFALQNVPRAIPEMAGLKVTPVEIASSAAKFDIFAAFIERDRQMMLRMEYSTEIFATAWIERMVGHFQTLLEGVVGNPEQRISDLPLVTEAEEHQVLVEWNATKREYPSGQCIDQLFEAQVDKTPDAVALVFEDQQLTYRELNSRANQLAHYLHKLGVGPEVLVGICMERSIDMVVGLLGILKAGGVYVPLDPEYPKERLGFMLEDTQAGIIVTDSESLDRLPPSRARVICLDRDRQAIAKQPQVNPDNQTTADNLAYVIYTSGSTGVPKGVAVPHRGVVRLLFSVDYAPLDATRTILHLAPISFDAATFEVWGALLHGGQSVLYLGKVPSPRELGEVLKQHRVDTLWLTAALFNTVIDEEPEALSEVKHLLIGGEALSVPHVRKGLALLAKTQIVNGYGPTESTTFTCCYRIPPELDAGATSIPIGKPIANTQVYILDRYLNPVPIGVPGELHIGGDGLARGYLNRPELTVEKFIGNPFSSDAKSRLYKTGDLGRYLPDGNIEFLGRIDDQVKIRGYRIELGEIEAVLGQHDAIQQAVVVAREDNPGDRRLVAYAVASPGMSASASELRSYLQHKLPEYMVPSAYVFLETLPLTANGKVDRKRLPIPEQSQSELQVSYVAPRTATEETLAKIWAEVLKVDQVGVRDNFFDLGGHSLLAVRLTTMIQRQFQTPIRVAHVFQAPTVEKFALLLQDPRKSNWLSLVALNSQGSRTPFFWVHGEASDAFLPRYLGPDQPLYGLRHQSEDGRPALYRTVEEIAAHYLEEIRSVQPQGPYLIGGYCFGALLALEMAQQLQAQGQRIDLLMLVNPSLSQIPEWRNTLPDIPSLLRSLRRRQRALASGRSQEQGTHISHGTKIRITNSLQYAIEPVKKVIQKIVWEVCIRLGVCIPVSMRSPYILEIYQNARRSYTPRRFEGNTILFLTNSRPQDPRLKYFGQGRTELKVHAVPGDHHTVLEEPNVGVWAKELKTYLERARHG